MENINLAITWNWEYDEDFITLVLDESKRRGISVLSITDKNLPQVLQKVQSGYLSIDVLFDRASDSDDAYLPLLQILEEHSTRVFNQYRFAERARDKSTMHLELISAGLFVPNSIILSPYIRHPFLYLSEKEVASLGVPFVIKPANTTGGGFGVHTDATSMMDIQLARQEYPYDKYLVQEKIYPKIIEDKRAWFRVLYAFGEVIPCWWDDTTHIYTEVTTEEEELYELTPLRNYMHTIQRNCKLHFFSSEIAFAGTTTFVVVDYVNEVCDMRLQSTCVDGVPDAIAQRVVSLLLNEVEITLHRSQVID